MQELMIRPTIYSFDNCRQFAEKFKLGKGDLLLPIRDCLRNFLSRWGLAVM